MTVYLQIMSVQEIASYYPQMLFHSANSERIQAGCIKARCVNILLKRSSPTTFGVVIQLVSYTAIT